MFRSDATVERRSGGKKSAAMCTYVYIYMPVVS